MAVRATAQYVKYRAWDTTSNTWKTGDAANHTLRWVKDNTPSALTNSPAEVDSTNAPGVYSLLLTASETDCLLGTLCGKSSSGGVVVMPVDLSFEAVTPTAAEITTAVWAATTRTLSSTGLGAIWSYALASIGAGDTIGNLIKSYLDAAISSRMAAASYEAPPSVVAVREEMDANSTKLAAILTDTAEIGVAGAGLNAIPWNANWDAEVQSECADAMAAYDPPTYAEMVARTLAAAEYATAAAVAVLPTAVEVREEIDANSTQLAAIVADTGAVVAKLPSAAVLTGTANATGAIDMASATGNYPGTIAGVAGTYATFDALIAKLAIDHGAGAWTVSYSTVASTVWGSAERTLTAGTKDAEIEAIKAKTDLLTFDGTLVQATVEMAPADLSNEALEAIRNGLALEATALAIKAKTDGLDIDVGTGHVIATLGGEEVTVAAASVATIQTGLALEATAQAIKTKTDQMVFTGTDLKATLDGEEVIVASASVTAIQTGLASAANLSAVKAKTDQMVFVGSDLAVTLDGEEVAVSNASVTEIQDAVATLLVESPVDVSNDSLVAIRNGLATEATSLAIKAQTDQMDFSGGYLSVVLEIGTAELGATSIATIRDGLALEATGLAIKAKTDQMVFVGSDLKATLDSEQVTVAAGSVTAIQTGLASAANLSAVKAKTDQLTFSGSDLVATLDGEEVALSNASVTEIQDAVATLLTESPVDVSNDSLVAIRNGLASEASVLAVKAQTDQMDFSGGYLSVVVEVGSVEIGATSLAAIRDGLALEASVQAVKTKSDQMVFVGSDLKATLDSELVGLTVAAIQGVQAGLASAADLALVKAKTDMMVFVGSDLAVTLDGEEVAVAAGSVTAIQTGLATEATASAIKTKTDQLLFSEGDLVATLGGETVAVSAASIASIQSGLALEATVQAIKGKTDLLEFAAGGIVADVSGQEMDLSTAALSAVRTGLALENTAQAIKAKTDVMVFVGSDIQATLANEAVALTPEAVAAVQLGLALEASVQGVKAQTDLLTFVGSDLVATLNGEEVLVAAPAILAIQAGLALEATAQLVLADTDQIQGWLENMVEHDIDHYRLKAGALEEAPTTVTELGTGIVDEIAAAILADPTYPLYTTAGGDVRAVWINQPEGAPIQFSYTSEMACQRADIEDLFGVRNVIKWADLDGDGDADKIEARITRAIVMVTCELWDRMRDGAYVVPITSPGAAPTVVNLAAKMAGLWLYEAKGVEDVDASTGQPIHKLAWVRKDVDKVLKEILSGQRRLDAVKVGVGTTAPVIVR